MGTITRREMLTAATALSISPALSRVLAAERRFRVGACDWSIGKRQDIGSFELAKQIGLDGVQFSFDDPRKPYDLRDPAERAKVLDASKDSGVAISSLAMGVLNRVPFSTDDRGEQWVRECIDVMPRIGQKIVLLAFFAAGDIKGKPDLQAKVIERLKRLAPSAEKSGVTLGLETWLDADEHMRILDAVASPAVKVYYDTANMEKMGYDIYAEIRRLGRDRICEFHMKENGALLGKGRCDFVRVKQAIDDIGYDGWLIIEGATVKGTPLVDCYRHNNRYIREVFGA